MIYSLIKSVVEMTGTFSSGACTTRFAHLLRVSITNFSRKSGGKLDLLSVSDSGLFEGRTLAAGYK